MSAWTEQRVLDATAAMEFVPEGAIEVLTGDYRLLRHSDWVLGPSLRAAQVGARWYPSQQHSMHPTPPPRRPPPSVSKWEVASRRPPAPPPPPPPAPPPPRVPPLRRRPTGLAPPPTPAPPPAA